MPRDEIAIEDRKIAQEERSMKPKTHDFEPGQTVYTLSGRRAEFVGAVAGGFLVRLGNRYEYEDGYEDIFDELEISPSLSIDPPVKIYHEEIAKLEEKANHLRQKISDLSTQVSEGQRIADDRLARYSKFDAIKHLDAFLNGEIEYFVTEHYGTVEIKAKDDALKQYDSYDKDLRLLTLYGRTKGDLQWRIAAYNDGSGTETDCWPCVSLDQAQAKAEELVNAHFDRWRADKDISTAHRAVGAAKAAEKLGFPVPDDVSQYTKDQQVAALKKKKEDLDKRRRSIETDLEKLGVIP